jgi:hypothetical protein
MNPDFYLFDMFSGHYNFLSACYSETITFVISLFHRSSSVNYSTCYNLLTGSVDRPCAAVRSQAIGPASPGLMPTGLRHRRRRWAASAESRCPHGPSRHHCPELPPPPYHGPPRHQPPASRRDPHCMDAEHRES